VAQALEKRAVGLRVAGQGLGFFPGLEENVGVPEQVGQAELGQARLTGAGDFPGTAQPQVGFGQAETVRGCPDGAHALAGGLSDAVRRHQDAARGIGASPDSSAKLVEWAIPNRSASSMTISGG
jgi:hypothetical protein